MKADSNLGALRDADQGAGHLQRPSDFGEGERGNAGASVLLRPEGADAHLERQGKHALLESARGAAVVIGGDRFRAGPGGGAMVLRRASV